MAIDEGATRFMREVMPFTAVLGIEVLANTAEEVRARVAWDESRCTSGGLLHGGLLMSLADSCGGACAFANLPEGAAGTSTIESKTNFFRGCRPGRLVGEAVPLHVGRRMIVVQTSIFGPDGKRAAIVTQTQLVLPRKPANPPG